MKTSDIKLLNHPKYGKKCRFSNNNLNHQRILVAHLNLMNNYLHNNVIYSLNRIFIDVLRAL